MMILSEAKQPQKFLKVHLMGLVGKDNASKDRLPVAKLPLFGNQAT